MPFKPVKKPAPQPVVLPVLVTCTFTLSVTNTEALVSATRAVLAGRGVKDADVLARIDDGTGHASLGECVKALMEESVAALAGATGADVGEIEMFEEQVVAPEGPLHTNVWVQPVAMVGR